MGDADKDLNCFEERQIDLIHVWREVNTAWQHGVDLETRKQYVNEVKGILLRLKNSLEKPDLKSRIEKAERLNEFANGRKRPLESLKVLQKAYEENSFVCIQRLEGINIPWHNNWMERLMK